MHCLKLSNLLLLATAAYATACGPTVGGELGDSGSDSDAATEGVDSSSTSDDGDTVDPDEGSDSGSPTVGTTDDPPPTGECGEPGSLAQLWRVDDPDRDRGESVSVSEDRVAWVATTWDPNTRIRVHDLEGAELWSADAATTGGEGALRQHDIAVGELVTSFVGTDRTTGSAVLQIYGDSGQVLFDLPGVPNAVDAGGTAVGSDSAVLFGGSNEDLLVNVFEGGGGGSSSDSYDHGGDEHVFDATTDGSGGYFLAGHSNAGGRPLLAHVSADGTIEWVVESSGGGFETANGVAADGSGGAWLAIFPGETGGGRLDHFDANGEPLEPLELAYGAVQVDVDRDGNLVVLGRDFPDAPIVVQRLTPSGDVLAETTMDGFWGLDLAVDDACDVYVSGSDDSGAFLVKLD